MGYKLAPLQTTYTHSFSGNPVKTPRYDYNQIIYALSLDDPRLYLPEARYKIRGSAGDGNNAGNRAFGTLECRGSS